MNKFFSGLLRIIMLLSFFGIIVFVTIAVINSQDIALLSYNYIVSEKSKIDIDDFNVDIKENVVAQIGLTQDPEAILISDALSQVSLGIDHFVDYLAFEQYLTKGEQDKLINDFKDFKNYYDLTNKNLEDYKTAYDRALEDGVGSAADAYLKEVRKLLIYNYKNCYISASQLFDNLVLTVKNYTFKNIDLKYSDLSFIIKDTLAKIAISEAFSENVTDIDSNSNVITFREYLISFSNYSDLEFITNESFRSFVKGLNSLDVYKLFSDYDNYISGLDEQTKSLAVNTKNFFLSEF